MRRRRRDALKEQYHGRNPDRDARARHGRRVQHRQHPWLIKASCRAPQQGAASSGGAKGAGKGALQGIMGQLPACSGFAVASVAVAAAALGRRARPAAVPARWLSQSSSSRSGKPSCGESLEGAVIREADRARFVGVVRGETLRRDRIDVPQPLERERDDVAPRDRLAAAVDERRFDVARDPMQIVLAHGLAMRGDALAARETACRRRTARARRRASGP